MASIVYPEDVLALKEIYWPHFTFADYQTEIVKSGLWNDETYVPAGNDLGKDLICGFIAVSAFKVCQLKTMMRDQKIRDGWVPDDGMSAEFGHPTCRIVTTSVAEHHLKVLWGEIGRFLSTSRLPLLAPEGGFVVNYQEIRRVEEAAVKNPLNYAVGRVSAKGEGMAGHHADFTLLIGDESSGIDDEVYKMGQGWADHMIWPGNCNQCQNFWRRNIKAGDLPYEARKIA